MHTCKQCAPAHTHQVSEELDVIAAHAGLELHPVLQVGRKHRALVESRNLLHRPLQPLKAKARGCMAQGM
jgi:hypothetical protein